jgi:NADPH2:quinone reductase
MRAIEATTLSGYDGLQQIELAKPQPWKRARMAGFSLFAQSPSAIAAAWRQILPLIVSGSVKPIVERVYPFGEAGEALRHLIEDRPFGKVVLAGVES